MTDAQAALAQVREALAAGPTPGPWSLKTVPTSDGSCHKIGPFPSASRIHSEAHACVYAIGIRLGINDSTPVARELLANARLMAACSPANIAAILAHVDAQAAEVERLTAALRAQPGPVSMDDVEWAGKVHLAEAIRERDEARAERDALRIELDVCRSAIEDCYDIVETFDCYNDSDGACQRATLRRLNEAIGKAAPRLLYERPEGQKLYGLRYRELMAERDALHAVATDAHRDIDELRRQLAEAYTRASEVARTLTISENGHARLVDPSGWIAETILGLTRPAEES